MRTDWPQTGQKTSVGRGWVAGGSRVGCGSGWGPDAAAQKNKKTSKNNLCPAPLPQPSRAQGVS